jgi:transcriptional regulator with XRE-family HTH domain
MKLEYVQMAATLRRMREEAGVTREEAAATLGCTRSKIGDLETGRSRPKPAELERLLEQYGITSPERDEMVEFARSSRTRRKPSPNMTATIPGTGRRAIDLEAQAISTIFYSPELIPGLLQIPEYATGLLEWSWENRPEDVAKRLSVRMARSAVLTRKHRPPLHYWCLLGEAALRTNIGGSKVMQEQIKHLIKLNESLKNLVIQVLPFGSGAHAYLGVTVTIHRFPTPAVDLMILESYDQEIVRDDPELLTRAAHHLDLIRAKALSREDSTDLLERLHRELADSDRES